MNLVGRSSKNVGNRDLLSVLEWGVDSLSLCSLLFEIRGMLDMSLYPAF